MYPVKQSTAIDVLFFAFDANGDGVTGKVDGDWTKRISKNGAAFAAMTVTVTERENGFYHLQLSAAHTDTLGVLTVSLSASGVKRVNLQFRIHARLPDDHTFPNTSGRGMDVDTSGGVEVGSFQTGAITAAAFGAGAIDAAAIADGAIDAATFAAGAITATAIASDAITDAKVASDVTIASVTGNIGGNVVGSIGSLAAQAKLDVNAEVDTALADVNLDHLVGTATGIPAIVAGTYLDQIMDDGTAVYDRTTDSLQAIRDHAATLATASALDTVDNFLDTEVGAIKGVTDKLDTALELDVSVWRYTVNALENAPAGGGGGGTDWNTDERTAIRSILGIPPSGSTPVVPSVGVLATINTQWDTARAESVPGPSVARSPMQILYELLRLEARKRIDGTFVKTRTIVSGVEAGVYQLTLGVDASGNQYPIELVQIS